MWVSLELFNQKSLNYKELYVALSRTTSLEVLYLKSPVIESMFRANQNVTEHYDHLLSCKNALNEIFEKSVFSLSRLNAKFRAKHARDVIDIH